LRGVYLKIETGKICGLFGVNGSGKSTLIKVGAGLLKPSEGSVFIDGLQFLNSSFRKRYLKIAYLPQDSFLPHDMKVKTFLHNLPAVAGEYILSHFPHHRLPQTIGALSGGERRLLELLFIISLDRKFILLDEPFTGIEPLYIERMSALISQQRASGKGVLLTDHYYRYTSEISDYGYYMTDGQCRKLEENRSIAQQLREHGYLASPLNKQA
jgi:lipopolysaccharide export system ATP-binding protein